VVPQSRMNVRSGGRARRGPHSSPLVAAMAAAAVGLTDGDVLGPNGEYIVVGSRTRYTAICH